MQDLTCNNSWPQALLSSLSEWAQVWDSSVLPLFFYLVWLSLGPLKEEGRCLYTLDKLIKSTAVISRVNLPHSRKYLGLPRWLSSKESACNAGDLGSIPGLGRSPGEGTGNPLQYSCLENPMEIGARWAAVHGVTKSQTWLSTHTGSICRRFLTWQYWLSYFGLKAQLKCHFPQESLPD